MSIKPFILILVLLASGSAFAQTLVKGTVMESGSNAKLENVFVRDANNKQATLTDKSGRFQINTEPGHKLVFSFPGYVTDTLYVIDLAQKRILMATQPISLKGVNITATRSLSFDPHKEYPDVYEKARVYPLSPSTWFGREAHNARRLKRYFKKEEEERHVDAVFTRAYVGGIIPLKGQELDDFMTMYRPTYAFIIGNNNESLAVYLNDAYKKYMALPADKRRLPKLSTE